MSTITQNDPTIPWTDLLGAADDADDTLTAHLDRFNEVRRLASDAVSAIGGDVPGAPSILHPEVAASIRERVARNGGRFATTYAPRGIGIATPLPFPVYANPEGRDVVSWLHPHYRSVNRPDLHPCTRLALHLAETDVARQAASDVENAPGSAGDSTAAPKVDHAERVVTFLDGADPSSRSAVAKAIGGTRADVLAAINAMVEDGRLVEVDGKRGKLVRLADA